MFERSGLSKQDPCDQAKSLVNIGKRRSESAGKRVGYSDVPTRGHVTPAWMRRQDFRMLEDRDFGLPRFHWH